MYFITVGCASLPQTAVNSSIRISGLPTSTAEGTNVIFTCPPGLVLSGPNVSTCIENGEWEPDPQELTCKGYHSNFFWHAHILYIDNINTYAVDCALPRNNNISLSFISTLDGSVLAFRCVTGLIPRDEQTAVCHKNGSWVPDPVEYNCFIPGKLTTNDRCVACVWGEHTLDSSGKIVGIYTYYAYVMLTDIMLVQRLIRRGGGGGWGG